MLTQSINRRKFIKQSALVTAGAMMVPKFLHSQSLGTFQGKRLIIIQLSGGNDGLNTVVPYENDDFYRLRPTLGIPEREVLKIDMGLGFHPNLKGLKSLYEQGDLCVINNVGYPNPNRSHFRSMDIWHSASNSNEYWDTGWVGRFLDSDCSTINYGGIQTNNILSTAMKGEKMKGVPVHDVNGFYRSSKQIQGFQQPGYTNSSADFLYKTVARTKQTAEYIFEHTRNYKTNTTYPGNKFGKQLKTIADLINSGIESRVYYADLGGFDTHFAQLGRHGRLMSMYDEGITPLVKDLKSNGHWEDTVIMTFSEFGRRVQENGSKGTDHGKANNVFIMGGGLKKKGFFNQSANLIDLDNGDLKYEIDFREIYSTLLNDWLGSNAEIVLKKKFESLSFV